MTNLKKIKSTVRGPALASYKEQLVLNQRQREIIIGVLLGDANLQTQDKGITYRLRFEQGKDHAVYVAHLFNEFFYWSLSEPKPYLRTNVNDKLVETIRFQTITHVSFSEFANLFLNSKGKKEIKANLVQNYVTPISLAYWFMDDGGKLDYGPNLGKGIVLHTQGFTEKEVVELAKGLKEKFKLQTKATKMKDKYVVSISGNSFEDFIRIIEPHILPSMKYKLPTPRKKS